MSEEIHSQPENSTPASHDVDPAALEHIVDETEERGNCQEWIYRQFVDGRDADSILAQLIGNSWDADDAEGMVEEARRATRHLRGVITRETVARAAERRYRKAFKVAFRVTLGAILLLAIMYGCNSLIYLRDHPQAKTPTNQP